MKSLSILPVPSTTLHSGSSAIETGKPITYESTVTRFGKTRYYLSTKAPYHDHSGRLIGALGISRDITGLKMVEEEIKRRSQQLEALSRRVVEVQEQERNQARR